MWPIVPPAPAEADVVAPENVAVEPAVNEMLPLRIPPVNVIPLACASSIVSGVIA